jgi:WD40 repeat protein
LLALLTAQPAWGEPPKGGGLLPLDTPKTDRYGDPLPPGVIARLGTVRFRNGDVIFSVVFSRDGKYLATSAGDTVRWWDVTTGKQVREFRGHPYGVECLAISPDGKVLASGSNDGTFRLWDVATGLEICCVQGHVLDIRSIAFSPNGKTLATAGRDARIRLWDAGTRKKTQELEGHTSRIFSVAFSPDGKLLASGGEDQTLRLWDISTGREVWKREAHTFWVRSVVFSPDSKTLVSSGWDKAIRLWSVADGKETGQLQAEQSDMKLVFSPDGKILISCSWDPQSLCFWDLATGKIIRRLQSQPWARSIAQSIALSPDGKNLALGGNDGIVHLWDVATGKEIRLFGGHRGAVRTIVFRPGEEVITGAEDGTARRWNAMTGKETQKILVQEIGKVTPSPDGKLLLCVPAPKHPEGGVLWDTATGKELHVLQQVSESDGRAFSQDGKFLATASPDSSVILWDVAKGVKVGRIPGRNGDWSRSLAFSPDGKTLAVGTHTRNTSLWDVATGKKIHQLVGHGHSVGGIAFAPDGRTLAAVDDRAFIRLWNAATGKLLHIWKGHYYAIQAIAFSPDGKFLATSAQTIRLWEAATCKEIRGFTGHRGFVGSLAFSPDTRLLASGGEDTSVLVWDIRALFRNGPVRTEALTPKELEGLWADLAGRDAGRAYQMIEVLASLPKQPVPLLEKQLRPVPLIGGRRIADLLADLEDNRFAIREKAMRELEKCGELAEQALRRRLTEKPPLDVCRRIDQLLSRLDEPIASPVRLRELRAITVLEYAGTAPARQVLENLAKGAPEARLTREAKASLERLTQRDARP